ncbi:MAG: hypothetical protein B7Z71_11615 [Acidocella sp. 21-58-7]|nr:MAG: hypothetical protein B7Z71_11615 [Acidocella sp. 21-58-7]
MGQNAASQAEAAVTRDVIGWDVIDSSHLVNANGAELVSHKRPGKKAYWTAIVPTQDPERLQFMKTDDGQLARFPNLSTAIQAVELFVSIRNEFSQYADRDKVDITAGNIGVHGGSY